jgi:hypothetical protein
MRGICLAKRLTQTNLCGWYFNLHVPRGSIDVERNGADVGQRGAKPVETSIA